MIPRRYFCLRSTLEPEPSWFTGFLIGGLALVIIVGVYLNIAVLG